MPHKRHRVCGLSPSRPADDSPLIRGGLGLVDVVRATGVVFEEVLVLAERVQHELEVRGKGRVEFHNRPVGAVQHLLRAECVPHVFHDER